MEQVTLGEISRKQNDHIISFNKFNEEVLSTLKEQNHQLNAILLQATKTNGRVLSLEASREATNKTIDEQKKSIDSLTYYKWWASGITAFLLTLGGFIYTQTIDNIKYELKNEIAQSVEEMLDERVNSVEKIK